MNNLNNKVSSAKQQDGIPLKGAPINESALKNFDELNIGDQGSIARCQGPNAQKLMVLGLTPGTQFSVVRVAPLGDPIEISLRGFSLTLRREELTGIKVNTL